MQKLYGVVGDPISHSLSPVSHKQLFQMTGREEHIYAALHIRAAQLPAAVEILRGNFEGFNVTIPHKQAVIPLLDELTAAAARCGAVNTIKSGGGRLVGHNTDGPGFTLALQLAGWDIAGSRVLLVGAGGAARAAAHELAEMGCTLTIANRTLAGAAALVQELQAWYPRLQAAAVALEECAGGRYDVVVNATPIGMGLYAGQLPVDLDGLQGVEYVYDLIYSPSQTELLRQGQALGCRVLNGLPMLVYQSALAQEFWLGEPIPEPAICQVLALLEEMSTHG